MVVINKRLDIAEEKSRESKDRKNNKKMKPREKGEFLKKCTVGQR